MYIKGLIFVSSDVKQKLLSVIDEVLKNIIACSLFFVQLISLVDSKIFIHSIKKKSSFDSKIKILNFHFLLEDQEIISCFGFAVIKEMLLNLWLWIPAFAPATPADSLLY